MGLRLRTPASVHLLYMPWLRLCACLTLPIGVPSPPAFRQTHATATPIAALAIRIIGITSRWTLRRLTLTRHLSRHVAGASAPLARPHPRPTLTSGRGWRRRSVFRAMLLGARGRLPSPGGRRRLRPPHAPNPRQVGAALPDALSPGPKPTRYGDDWDREPQDGQRKGSPIGQPVTKGAAADLLTSASVALSVHALSRKCSPELIAVVELGEIAPSTVAPVPYVPQTFMLFPCSSISPIRRSAARGGATWKTKRR